MLNERREWNRNTDCIEVFLIAASFNLMSQQSTDRSIDQVGGGRIVKEMISEIEVNRQINLIN